MATNAADRHDPVVAVERHTFTVAQGHRYLRRRKKAIVINGLPIGAEVENGETTAEYYERHVIGRPGSFIIPADSSAEFQWAIINKLIREVSFISRETRS
ncbi:DUF1194 domain-containing protein [Mesorhizobium sp. C420B]|uniref:DUF1194 domain-containing protein n=1 Tax=Mesorhizobium sp. C420B TaxID=2956835 RepID=UPI00333C66A3